MLLSVKYIYSNSVKSWAFPTFRTVKCISYFLSIILVFTLSKSSCSIFCSMSKRLHSSKPENIFVSLQVLYVASLLHFSYKLFALKTNIKTKLHLRIQWLLPSLNLLSTLQSSMKCLLFISM